MIQAAIFDMDGLLIDSEPLWQIAEKEVFGNLGLNLTTDDLKKVQGMKLSEVVRYWYNFQPWSEPDFAKVERKVLERVAHLIETQGRIMPGVIGVLEFFKSLNLPIALASASDFYLINKVLDKLRIRAYFDVVHSAQNEKRGKPFPDVFLTVAQRLNLQPERIIVFEDSRNGIKAANAAGMIAVGVNAEKNFFDNCSSAHIKLKSLEEWTPEIFEQAAKLFV